jgi:hypothetical protein
MINPEPVCRRLGRRLLRANASRNGKAVVRDNQSKVGESIKGFWRYSHAHPAAERPTLYVESVEKGHGRITL